MLKKKIGRQSSKYGKPFTKINIVDKKSRPPVDGTWSVRFNTTGKSDLKIIPVNGTSWTGDERDIEFLNLMCGNRKVEYSFENGAVVVSDYSCDSTSIEKSTALTSGKHHLKFSFGNETEYAHNQANNPYMMLLYNGSSIPSGWSCISCSKGDDLHKKFMIGNDTYGITGGSKNHTHNLILDSISTNIGSVRELGTDLNASQSGHDHNLESNSSSASNLPVYRNLSIIVHDSGIPSDIPKNGIAIFNDTIPANWQRYSPQDNFFVRGSETSKIGGSGGDNNHSHPSTLLELGRPSDTTGLFASSGNEFATGTHNHNVTEDTSYARNAPPYINITLARATSQVERPQGIIAMFNATPSGDWVVKSGDGGEFHERFIRGDSNYGATGGSRNHSHEHINTTTRKADDKGTVQAATSFNADPSDADHTHEIDVSFKHSNHLPPYINVIFAWDGSGKSAQVLNETVETTIDSDSEMNTEWSGSRKFLSSFKVFTSRTKSLVVSKLITDTFSYNAPNARVLTGVRLIKTAAGLSEDSLRGYSVARLFLEGWGLTSNLPREFTGERLLSDTYGVVFNRQGSKLLSEVSTLSVGMSTTTSRVLSPKRAISIAIDYSSSLARQNIVGRIFSDLIGYTSITSREQTISRLFNIRLSAADSVKSALLFSRIIEDNTGFGSKITRRLTGTRDISFSIGLSSTESRSSIVGRLISDTLSTTIEASGIRASIRLIQTTASFGSQIITDSTITRLIAETLRSSTESIRSFLPGRTFETSTYMNTNILGNSIVSRTVIDDFKISRYLIRGFSGSRSIPDTYGISTTETATRKIPRSIEDSIGVSSTPFRTTSVLRAISQTVGFASELTRTIIVSRTFTSSFDFASFLSYLLPSDEENSNGGGNGGGGGGGGGSGGGSTGGGGAGGGQGGLADEPKIGIDILTNNLSLKLASNETTNPTVTFENNGTKAGEFSLRVEGVSDLVDVENATYSLNSGSSKTVKLRFNADADAEPGIYEGELIVESDGVSRNLPIRTIVKKKVKQLIDVNLSIDRKNLVSGEEIGFKVKINNGGGEGSINITLTLSLKDSEGNVIYENRELSAVETSTSLSRGINKELNAGEYQLEVIAEYNNRTVKASDTFEVSKKEYKPFLQRELLGLPIFVWLILMLLATGIGVLYYMYREDKIHISALEIYSDYTGENNFVFF